MSAGPRSRTERDAGAVENALADVRAAIENDETLMPTTVDAVKTYATMGMGIFGDNHGSDQETAGLARVRFTGRKLSRTFKLSPPVVASVTDRTIRFIRSADICRRTRTLVSAQ